MLIYKFDGLLCPDTLCAGEMVTSSVQTGNVDIIGLKCTECNYSIMIIPVEKDKEYTISTKETRQLKGSTQD